MTTDIDGNYRGVYTYGIERISEEDLGNIEGRPNDPLYYLHDALGTTTSITNMNAGIIDSNRFAPYGEPLDPVAKNSRLTNSPFGFTGEQHDIEGGLVYLRARYYEPGTARFIQQDTLFGEIREPLTRNLYLYCKDNPLSYVDPSGNWQITVQEYSDGYSYASLEFEDSKILATMAAGINALPGGSAFDYYGKIERGAGILTSLSDGSGGLIDFYVYKPGDDIINRLQNWDSATATVNDILSESKAYNRIAEKLTSPIAKNIVRNAAWVVTAGFFLYDTSKRYNRVERDNYLYGMIRAAGLKEYISKINDPDDLFMIMIYIEAKLDSYGEDYYKLYNQYFSGIWGLDDYTDDSGITWWDKITGNEQEKRKKREEARDILNRVADRLENDFRIDIQPKK